MDPLAFIASLVGSLAWPVVVVVLALVFRPEVSALLKRPVHRVKAGPVEVEWDPIMQAAQAQVATSPEARDLAPAVTAERDLDDRLHALAELSPGAAVMASFIEVESSLNRALDEAGAPPERRGSARQLVQQAYRLGLVSEQTSKAIDGLSVLRNLVAHGHEPDLDEARAHEFVALCSSVIYAIESGSERHRAADTA